MDTPLLIGAALGSALIGVLLAWLVVQARLRRASADAHSIGLRIRKEAEEAAGHIRKAAELAGRQEALEAREEWEREETRRRE